MSLEEDIVELRQAVRAFVHAGEASLKPYGACSTMAGLVEARMGYGVVGGCYVLPDGRHAVQTWNVLPDGRYLDVTADQFGEPAPGIRVTPSTDRRYILDCWCDVRSHWATVAVESMDTARLTAVGRSK